MLKWQYKDDPSIERTVKEHFIDILPYAFRKCGTYDKIGDTNQDFISKWKNVDRSRNMMWRKKAPPAKVSEADEGELTEDEVINDLEVVYRQLEKVKAKLDQCYDVELREKYMRHLCDFMNWLDYEI